MTLDQARQRAERNFQKEERQLDARKARTKYDAQARATREKTARLKALRFSGSSSVFGPRSSQIGYRRSTGFALVEPCAFMFKPSVRSHKKPVGLPSSTAPDKNIRMFVPQNLEHFLTVILLMVSPDSDPDCLKLY